MRRNWWLGWERTDPEGYRCRVGALWTRLFLKKGWALTASQTVWIRDPRTWRRYLRNEFWRAHEHHHVWQERHRFPNTVSYLAAFVWQYVRYRSHDAAPLEVEADEAARIALAIRTPEDQDT